MKHALLSLLFVACIVKTIPAEDRLCTPGNYVYCKCVDSSQGTKLCKQDGRSFTACSHCLSGKEDPPEEPPPAVVDAGATFDAGFCAAQMEGTPCGPAPDRCHEAPRCKAGLCVPGLEKPDESLCDVGPSPCFMRVCRGGACVGDKPRPDGYAWLASNPLARCCGGQPEMLNNENHCGACGAMCNRANGEQCALVEGRPFCTGCQESGGCWTGCCSKNYAIPVCEPSDCSEASVCVESACPAGSTCTVTADDTPNFCAYP